MLKYELISNIGSQLTLKIFSNNTQYLVKLQKYENQKGIYVTDLYNYKWECFLNGDQKTKQWKFIRNDVIKALKEISNR